MASNRKLTRPTARRDMFQPRWQALPAAQLRNVLGLDRKLFSRLTGYSERAIANGKAGNRVSAFHRVRVTELQRLQQALARVMKVEYIRPWLHTPNPAFHDLQPIELIERGDIDRIWRMIRVLEGGWPG